jgi:hypothetical protein
VPLGRFEIKGPVKLTINDGKGDRNWQAGRRPAVRAR